MKFLSHDGLIYFWGKTKDYVDSKCDQLGGTYVGDTAPENTKLLWVDTGNGGVLKYYDGTSWTTTKAIWG